MSNDFLKISDFDSISKAIYLFTPMQYGINTLANKAHNANYHTLGKAISIAEYFVTPLDRMIQFISIPIFSVITDVYTEHKKKQPVTAKLIVDNAKASLNNIFVNSLGISMLLFCNTAANIITGYKIYKALDEPNATDHFFKAREQVRKGKEVIETFLCSDEQLLNPKPAPTSSNSTKHFRTNASNSRKQSHANESNRITFIPGQSNCPLVQKSLADFKVKVQDMIRNKVFIAEISHLVKHASSLNKTTQLLYQSAVQIFGYDHIDDIQSKQEIEQRRKFIIKHFHPDRNEDPQQQELGKEINKVYDIILDFKNW